MLILISPAKSLFTENENIPIEGKPYFTEETSQIVDFMKEYKVSELMDLMKISEALASVNQIRFQDMFLKKRKVRKQAVYLFDGDVYDGLQVRSFQEEELKSLGERLIILSGMYGILRPFDLIYPHRLEMGTSVRVGGFQNLHQFWRPRLSVYLNRIQKKEKPKYLINLASNEYFQSIDTQIYQGKIIHIHFREEVKGVMKQISFFAKKARGIMAAYLIKNKIMDPHGIQNFQEEGYRFDPSISNEDNYYFIRKSI
jgi:cytoplasmic iron level regulating protein YaaA (DUF328/UPF0246 family)